MQDTVLTADKALTGARAGAVAAWLYRIATHTARDALRHHRRLPWLPFVPGDAERRPAPARALPTCLPTREAVRPACAGSSRRRMPACFRAGDGLSRRGPRRASLSPVSTARRARDPVVPPAPGRGRGGQRGGRQGAPARVPPGQGRRRHGRPGCATFRAGRSGGQVRVTARWPGSPARTRRRAGLDARARGPRRRVGWRRGRPPRAGRGGE